MTAISIPNSRPLDSNLSEVLRRMDAACRALDLPYLLTGAMAREILLVHVHGLPPGRATRDVDFGVMVKTWGHFEALKNTLAETGDFEADSSVPHRVYTVASRLGLRMPVDLVPFGGVERADGSVAWPPEGSVVMDVRGYEAAHRHALHVEVLPGVLIPLPSAAGIAVMKVLAWKDRGHATQGRDAVDLVEILERAEDILGLDALYEDHLSVFETWGGDPRLAAAAVLGTQSRALAEEALAHELADILGKDLEASFIPQALRGRGLEHTANGYEVIQGIVKAFGTGLRDQTRR